MRTLENRELLRVHRAVTVAVDEGQIGPTHRLQCRPSGLGRALAETADRGDELVLGHVLPARGEVRAVQVVPDGRVAVEHASFLG